MLSFVACDGGGGWMDGWMEFLGILLLCLLNILRSWVGVGAGYCLA
jgi:hypothetical protein